MRRTFVGCAVAVVMVLVLAPAAQATDSRSQSLLYNLAFPDQTDAFLFPQVLPEYEGIYLHLPSSINEVYGGLIYNLDAGSAVGVFIRRPMLTAFEQYRLWTLDSPSFLGSMAGAASAVSYPHVPGQIFDLLYGAKSWGLGLRVHLWSETSSQQGILPGETEATSTFSTELNGGFNLSKGSDMRTSLGIRFAKDAAFVLLFRAGLRSINPEEKKVRSVLAGQLEFGFYSPDSGDASIYLGVPFRMGYRIALIPEKLFVGLLGGLDVQMLKLGSEDIRLGLAVPTMEMATEWNTLSWMQLRASIRGGYGIQFAGAGDDMAPKHEQLAFSSGISFFLGPFQIDGVIQYDLWQNGPYIFFGNPGLFTGVTASFHWGSETASAASAPSTWTEETAAPVVAPPPPEPKPVTRPAPVAEPKPAVEEKKKDEKKKAGSDPGSFEGWKDE